MPENGANRPIVYKKRRIMPVFVKKVPEYLQIWIFFCNFARFFEKRVRNVRLYGARVIIGR